ncbi:ABC transporter ATP-binding protein [Sphingobacterium bovistauri]|uniref:ABC transporter ATP-binding protein n=1 Tax=Sphingobacterium bovistauri TaxID=2781959 RepID=A0ABS7Z1U7_9SPHI|nr:ABC transporter ATP-binding protein [Sphingobacterium bovistauri]MCA5004130.1 ABC transporter ATP-binding protein [Sphingobacterium bovistauri]
MMIISSRQFQWLLKVIDGYKLKMIVYFLLEVSSILLSLLFIYYSKRTIDISMGATEGDLNISLSIVICCAISGVLLRSVSQWMNQRTQVSLLSNLQSQVLKSQMLSTWRTIKKWDTGNLLVRLNSDCNDIVQMVSTTWISLVVTGLKITASFIFLYSMDKMLAWIILCISPLFFLTKIYYKKMKALNVNVKNAESDLGSNMEENLRYRIILRSLGILPYRLNLFLKRQSILKNLRFRYLNFTGFSQLIMRICMITGYLLAFSWGVHSLKTKEITFGTMTAFLQLVNQIQSPIMSLGAFFPAFVKFRVSLNRVQEIDDSPKDNLEEAVVFDSVQSIKLRNVSFQYDSDVVIANLNEEFRKGEAVVVLGESGKGKTTLIRLLLGVISPDKGEIIIEGNNNNYQLTSSHIENFSYVPQGNTLLRGTVRENITLGIVSVDEEKLKEVIYYSCSEFIYDLPNGLETTIGDSGIGLSEGQAQRIGIARALLRNKNVWIFDEATSALDAETTNKMLNRIKDLISDKIVIFVTHNPNVDLFFDKRLLIN